MKLVHLSYLILCSLLVSSCTKTDKDIEPISYPEVSLNGINLLAFQDSVVLDASDEFSLTASIPEDQTLEIRLHDLNEANAAPWLNTNVIDWDVSAYSTTSYSQVYEAKGQTEPDLTIKLQGSGSLKITFCENENCNQSKIVFWE